MSVRHESGGIEGVAQGGQVREGSGREKMGDGGASRAVDVQGWYGASGYSVDKDGTRPERGGGL